MSTVELAVEVCHIPSLQRGLPTCALQASHDGACRFQWDAVTVATDRYMQACQQVCRRCVPVTGLWLVWRNMIASSLFVVMRVAEASNQSRDTGTHATAMQYRGYLEASTAVLQLRQGCRAHPASSANAGTSFCWQARSDTNGWQEHPQPAAPRH